MNAIYTKNQVITNDTDNYVKFKKGYYANRISTVKNNKLNNYATFKDADTPQTPIKTNEVIQGRIRYVNSNVKTEGNESVEMLTKFDLDKIIPIVKPLSVDAFSKRSDEGRRVLTLPVLNNSPRVEVKHTPMMVKNICLRNLFRKQMLIGENSGSTDYSSQRINYIDCLAMDNKIRSMNRDGKTIQTDKTVKTDKSSSRDSSTLRRAKSINTGGLKAVKHPRLIIKNGIIRNVVVNEKMENKV
jgi:hypothetical protein